ncbi:MAG: DNA mismatch repair protein MutL [Chloroflexi bacterium ADurb.Bin180]|nr:MAG: DNA mismatch repair protein MutL [Chloroflexi bacterium ADurb.Bin180]
MPIRLLPPTVANKIAAGEVVERPASVVKELLENAIDAGATDIRVEIRQGGRRLIRVTDDGAGIPSAEVALAFARHATSKILAEDDLLHIRTLGFRGEALASIAAVSHTTMLTRAASEEIGTQLRIQGGDVREHRQYGGPAGTSVTVENLFFNTPARLKFLRSEPTESSHIIKLVSAYAMAYPELRFELTDNGRPALQTAGDGKLLSVLIKVFGLDTAQQMLALDRQPDGTLLSDPAIIVDGYVGTPSQHRASRDYQLLFVNRRWIQDRSLSFAIEEAYRTLIPSGRCPIAVLRIQLDPQDVDVNVHPTKREVRFREPRAVFAAVQRAVRSLILGQAPVAPLPAEPHPVVPEGWAQQPPIPWVQRPPQSDLQRGQFGLDVQRTAAPVADQGAGVPMHQQLPMLRVLGQIRQMYIIAEGPDGLYLIDQHAAHERVLFELLLAEKQSMGIAAQNLLEPLPVELAPRHQSTLEAAGTAVAELGFDIAPFGGTTYLLRALPAIVQPQDAKAVLTELLDAVSEGRDPATAVEEMVDVIACHSAVRAGQTLTLDESRQLIQQLEKTISPYTCPHGRPTMIRLSTAQLERSFMR